jgi:hypothetical protein
MLIGFARIGFRKGLCRGPGALYPHNEHRANATRKFSAQNTKPRILLRHGVSVVDPYYPHAELKGFGSLIGGLLHLPISKKTIIYV